jgi:hypothetical protein
MKQGPLVEVAELRAVLSRVLDEVELRFGASIELRADHYWQVDDRAAFDMSAEPSRPLEVGQLSDDVAELRRTLQDSEHHGSLWHDLRHVVGILRRIAVIDLPDGSPS